MIDITLNNSGLLIIAGEKDRSLFADICMNPESLISVYSCCRLLSGIDGSEPPLHLALELFYRILEMRLRLGVFTAVETPALSQSLLSHIFELCNTYYAEPSLVITGASGLSDSQKKIEAYREKGFKNVWVLDRESLFNCRLNIKRVSAIRDEKPPFDIIGDIHGCYDELEELFYELGYEKKGFLFEHPAGRMPVFIGDVADRGPYSIKMIEFTANMVEAGKALYVPGNHCVKFMRWLNGSEIKLKHGVETTIEEYTALEESERQRIKNRFTSLVENSSIYICLDNGNLVISHAGIREKMIGREHRKIRAFCLFGATTGKTNENGFPERIDWAADYTGKPFLVYGHTPVEKAVIRNNTINIDQGCVFGGSLTAFRYPEMTTVSVKAKRTYYCRNSGQVKNISV
ncbi:MAG: metallophosphoesterase [Firmicutes bacterium]|nr:metallophosphoesterase [Bacillota bacterium]